VGENVEYGMRVRKVAKDERAKRRDEALEMVRLSGYADRKPSELSGGQQQRVALARALAVNPDCLLLDEPLSNLDAKLRHEMRAEIRRICKTAGFTTIYVTHDMKEALSVADRIAVMKGGRVAQVGTPGELYHHPSNSFVADFIGHTNLLRGKVLAAEAGRLQIDTQAGRLASASNNGASPAVGAEVIVSIRPEQMQVVRGTGTPDRNRMVGAVQETTFLGEASEHVLAVNGARIKVISAPPLFNVPAELAVEFDAEDVVVLKE
jgi:iron(III) transport system ATP-binding protein